MFETDEDDDFAPSSSANLFSIFNTAVPSDDGSNLSYKAPKQPKGNGNITEPEQQNVENKATMQAQSSVLLSKVITLWKLENGHNKLLGKHIVAIIGNMDQHLYEIIVYQEKTKMVIRHPLDNTLILYKYPKNFIGIFDSHKQFWNLNFESIENLESFLNVVSKYNCQIIHKTQNGSQDQVDTKINNLTKPDLQSVEIKNTDPVQSESSCSMDTSKDKILSRIKKMGQQIIPKNVTTTDLSDSETDSTQGNFNTSKPSIAPRKFRRNQNLERGLLTPMQAESNILHNSYSSNDNRVFSNNNQIVSNPHGLMYSQPYPEYGVSSYLIAQNTELKANLADINLKLAHVLKSPVTDQREPDSKSKIKCLNLKIENLQIDIQKSNQSLEELKKKYDRKCLELIKEQEKNENCKNLIEEVDRLKEELRTLATIKSLNKELSASIKVKEELIEIQQFKLKDYEDKFMKNQDLNNSLQKEISQLNSKIEELTLKIEFYESKKVKEKENKLNEPVKTDLLLQKDIFNKKIKETMNEAFRNIMEQFSENIHYDFNDIQEVVLENLKKTTYSLINAVE